MRPITVLPYEDIELLLDCNGISIPSDKREMYEIAEELIKKDVSECFSKSVMNYHTAYMLSTNSTIVKMKNYAITEIDSLSYSQLAALGRLLLIYSDVDRETIKEILFYLGKIIDETPNILPDVLPAVLKYSNIWDIENIYHSCKQYQDLCQTVTMKKLIINRLPADDNLDVLEYSFEELIRYYKISLLKPKMGLYYGKEYYICPDRTSFYANGKIFYCDEILNQIVQCSDNVLIILSAKGRLFSYNLLTKKYGELFNTEKICGIFATYERDILILTASKTYSYRETAKSIDHAIIQRGRALTLTDKGEVYYRQKKLALPKIKQIIDYQAPEKLTESCQYFTHVLTHDDQLCSINMYTFDISYHERVMRLANVGQKVMILDYDGNISKVIIKGEEISFERIEGKYQDLVGGYYLGMLLALTIDGEYKILT